MGSSKGQVLKKMQRSIRQLSAIMDTLSTSVKINLKTIELYTLNMCILLLKYTHIYIYID